ncbi:MAG: alcohol dehydrogenase catalytic domain-containing protein [Balneolaceae bacterium]
MKNTVIERKFLIPFILVTSMFFMWGLANNMTDTLLAAFKRIMSMTRIFSLKESISKNKAINHLLLMKISSIVLQKPGSFQIREEYLDTHLKPGDALLKVHRVGICGTDLHAYAGEQPFFTYPRILGHELGVEVVEIGPDVDNVKIGDSCAVEPYRYRPGDQAVERGKPNCAEHMSVLGVHEDGVMRDYFKFPAKFLHPSNELTFDQLALVETLGIGCHAVRHRGCSGY